MKFLLFTKYPYEYGAEMEEVTVGVLRHGMGAYQKKDADILKKLHGDLIEEITEEQYGELKKKLMVSPVTYQVSRTIQQDANKNPNAVYAEEPAPAVQSKDLVKVGKAKLESPLDD
jgi:hypothetical protein